VGLDLFVMPLWRFFAGRFEGPVEAIGAKRIGTPKPDDSEFLARGRVVRLRKGLEDRLGKPLAWSDEGTVALTLQYSYPALQALRAFAAYQDHPFPRDPGSGRPLPFEVSGSSPEEHPSLLCLNHLDAPTRYSHLIDHSDCSGFYLPCEFTAPQRCLEFLDGEGDGGPLTPGEIEDAIRASEGDVAAELFRSLMAGDGSEERAREQIERLRRETNFAPKKAEPPPEAPPGKHVLDWYKAGSSVRLLWELDELNLVLGMTRDWGDLKSGERMAPDGDALGLVKYGWGVLHFVARVSVERRLPIIFDG